jgi:hypothetical protein
MKSRFGRKVFRSGWKILAKIVARNSTGFVTDLGNTLNSGNFGLRSMNYHIDYSSLAKQYKMLFHGISLQNIQFFVFHKRS